MDIIHTIGRRKTSVARVYTSKGKGEITVNKKKHSEYFTTPSLQYKIMQPFILTNTEGDFDLKITVKGGEAMVRLKQFVLLFQELCVKLTLSTEQN